MPGVAVLQHLQDLEPGQSDLETGVSEILGFHGKSAAKKLGYYRTPMPRNKTGDRRPDIFQTRRDSCARY
jgi:hypothetical protein